KSLAKTPEMRYQSGRDLTEDLLALTRPGSTPTLRQAEVATAPGMRVPAAPPTINATPTLHAAIETANSAAPATVVSPAAAPAPPRRSPPPPPMAAGPRAQAAPASSGSNTGLLVGIAAGAFVLLLGVGAAGWYFFSGRGGSKPASGTLDSTATTPTSMAAATT